MEIVAYALFSLNALFPSHKSSKTSIKNNRLSLEVFIRQSANIEIYASESERLYLNIAIFSQGTGLPTSSI